MKYILALIVGLQGVLVGNFYLSYPPVEYVEAQEVEIMSQGEYEAYLDAQEPDEWSRERIEAYIREVFPEDPDTAVAIAKCESGLRPDIQSKHTLSYGQERSFGVFQVHEPDWHDTAWETGNTEYKYDVVDNVQLARHIYELAGNSWTPWSCYTKRMI